MSVRHVLAEVLAAIWDDFVEDVEMPDWSDDVVLLESGLDSLAFAVAVTELEDKLGFDPFTESEDPYYPVTFGEFVAFYEAFAAHR